MFEIELVGTPGMEYNEPSVHGRITLGDFSEAFIAPLVFWSVDDYRKQWREAADRIVNGEARSCFATAMHESPEDGAIFLWTAYRLADTVYFQHKLVLPETIKVAFDASSIYTMVDERETVADDGHKISEWEVSVDEIESYLSRLTNAHLWNN